MYSQYLSGRWSFAPLYPSTLTADRQVNKNTGHHTSCIPDERESLPRYQDTTTHAPWITTLTDTWVRYLRPNAKAAAGAVGGGGA